jgi:hypothetical protein
VGELDSTSVNKFSEKELIGNARCCGQESNFSREKLEKCSQRKVIRHKNCALFPLVMSVGCLLESMNMQKLLITV